MSQYFLTTLQFDNAKLWFKDALQQLDRVLYRGDGSIFRCSSAQVDEAIARKFEQHLRQGSVPGNLKRFAAQFPELNISLDGATTVQSLVLELARHSSELKTSISKQGECEEV